MKLLSQHREPSAHKGPADLVFCKSDGKAWNSDVSRKDVLYPTLDRLQFSRPVPEWERYTHRQR